MLVKILQRYDRIEALDMGPIKKGLTITLSPADGVKVRGMKIVHINPLIEVAATHAMTPHEILDMMLLGKAAGDPGPDDIVAHAFADILLDERDMLVGGRMIDGLRSPGRKDVAHTNRVANRGEQWNEFDPRPRVGTGRTLDGKQRWPVRSRITWRPRSPANPIPRPAFAVGRMWYGTRRRARHSSSRAYRRRRA